ncbi:MULTISPECIES: DNA-directed RNA polymerase subunit alpha C-terminal domain-containing protein [unclassified Geodermatophilus]|uniref:DNA-directed RNA polymerase subunit alpha C-terminal domain-containing protein n=1 Tax=unclassified Geodermatophilus TaxID=2637632 RepID=UPI003EEEC965
MPTRSTGPAPARTIADLGLPGRAVTALTRAGVTRVDDLAALTRRELAAVPGLGTGLIAAIRLVVPEPHPSPSPVTGTEPRPAETESPLAPPIPSFDSLRGPRRRTAVDLLVPDRRPPDPPPVSAPRPAPAAPRPAEYADLLHLGARLARAAAGVPWRVARWSVQLPVRRLRGLLGR